MPHPERFRVWLQTLHMKTNTSFVALFSVLLIWSCAWSSCDSESEMSSEEISLISITYNGAPLIDGATQLDLEAQISLTFSSSLSQADFQSAILFSGPDGSIPIDLVYTNSSSKVTFSVTLQPLTSYVLRIESRPVSSSGGGLSSPFEVSFSTREDSLITSMPPCTNPPSCLQSIQLGEGTARASFQYYGSLPIFEDQAIWQDIRQAVIVVHGASHNPDAYFSYLTNTLKALDLSDNTVLIAPFFRDQSNPDSDTYYWNNLTWRDGRPSANNASASSFALLDSLMYRLSDSNFFPALNHIIVTGQSSGGRFTHLYSAANTAEETFPNVTFDYIISESQYFYYPDGRRVLESTGQLYTPTGCSGYDIWPFGYSVVPPVLSSVPQATFNERFVNRHLVYLLGSGNATDNTLNTTDCSATLLGSTRFRRGEHMLQYMNLAFPTGHNHEKVIVPGVSHNGSAIYQSAPFKDLITTLLQQ